MILNLAIVVMTRIRMVIGEIHQCSIFWNNTYILLSHFMCIEIVNMRWNVFTYIPNIVVTCFLKRETPTWNSGRSRAALAFKRQLTAESNTDPVITVRYERYKSHFISYISFSHNYTEICISHNIVVQHTPVIRRHTPGLLTRCEQIKVHS